MSFKPVIKIPAISLSQEFELEYCGDRDAWIGSPGSILTQDTNKILWAKNEANLKKIKMGTVVVSELLKKHKNPGVNYLFTSHSPRLIFAKILNKHFNDLGVSLSNDIQRHLEDPKIVVGDNSYIGHHVSIGSGTVIYPNVVIHNQTSIGCNCVIKSFTSIASDGLGFENVDGELVKFPQIGGVIIGDEVEIGPNSTVRRAALDNTIIRDGCKIGALSNIGHNCVIGENSILTCQCVTGSSSILGNNVYMGINSIIKNGNIVGNNVKIGQGAVVTRDVPDNSIVVGNPAEPIENYKKWSTIRKKLLNEI